MKDNAIERGIERYAKVFKLSAINNSANKSLLNDSVKMTIAAFSNEKCP